MAKFQLVALALLAAVVAALAGDGPGQDNYIERIYIAEPDGSGMKPLVDLPEYRRQGSPTWSQDGKRIAFDAWRPQLGERLHQAKIIVVNADGSDPCVLGDGAMPSFSPHANRIVYSRHGANQGVWIMSAAGPEKECFRLDANGWSADWAPDGRHIVYATDGDNAQPPNLLVYDLVEGTRRPLFDAQTARYQSFFWNFTWSPDSRRIVFKGERGDGSYEMGIVDARGAQHGLITRVEGEIMANFAWRPDDRRILFAYPRAGKSTPMQLWSIDPDTKQLAELLPGQDPLRSNTAAAFSPDGRKIAMVSGPRKQQK